MENPWMHTVTLLAANTNYNLGTLMAAISPTPDSVTFLQIQADTNGGAAKFRIGGASLSDTDYGALLTASQSQTFQDNSGTNLISTSGVYVRCDTAEKVLSIITLQR